MNQFNQIRLAISRLACGLVIVVLVLTTQVDAAVHPLV